MAREYHQGKFRPKNPMKYRGDPTDIVYRSSWELRVFNWLDSSKYCSSWGSETVIVPYISPLDGKQHRYFVDLKATFKYSDGQSKTFLIEIKPAVQCVAPKGGKGKSKQRLVEESQTYMVNQAKWEAATRYAQKCGYEFKVITEYDIGLK